MDSAPKKKPEQWLDIATKQSVPRKRGKLTLFVGFAAGVGKTYEMLQEANRRKQREHQDVVIGYVETHGRQGTMDQIGALEIIPRKKINYHDTLVEEMDLDAILQRKPLVCVVDELAHTNVPGSKHEKRWEDVYELLDAQINVLSTVNIQHLESLNEKVLEITGIKVRETLPDEVLRDADEVVDVDVTPGTLLTRIERGEVYRRGNIEQALQNFFREDRLAALRELCMRELAHRVEKDKERTQPLYSAVKAPALNERILLCIIPGPHAPGIISRGNRLAKVIGAEIEATYIRPLKPPRHEAEALEDVNDSLQRLDIPFTVVEGGNPAREIARYAKEHGITHLVMGHSSVQGLASLFRTSVFHEILRYLPDIDITVVGEGL